MALQADIASAGVHNDGIITAYASAIVDNNLTGGTYSVLAENVGMASSIDALHSAWMRSSTHKTNILGNYNRIGTGVVRKGSYVYGIQIFYRAC